MSESQERRASILIVIVRADLGSYENIQRAHGPEFVDDDSFLSSVEKSK